MLNSQVHDSFDGWCNHDVPECSGNFIIRVMLTLKKVRYAVVIAAPKPWNTAISRFMCQGMVR